MSQNMHVLRSIRLQLKSGFLRRAPAAFTLLRQYPPLNRDTALPVRRVETRNIPYLDLYEKATTKNPLYADEKVYPAYWAHEPQALTLAKKQYEYMQKGQTEEEAYQNAVKYVNTLENESYLELNKIVKSLDFDEPEGVRLPFMANPDLAAKVKEYRAKVNEAGGLDFLGEVDDAQADYYIQTQVLGWNEVERERRMRDPIFVQSFNILRDWILAPEGITKKETIEKVRMMRPQVTEMFNAQKNDLRTEEAFYFEDYAKYFHKLREVPLLGQWTESERIDLSHWIIDTLAYRHGLRNASSNSVQAYLDQLRAHFFPMVRYPNRAKDFELPSREDFKKILYKAKVGYKTQGDKVFVQRFYMLPQLLFPKETLTTTLTADPIALQKKLSTENGLLDAIANAGHDEKAFPELEQELRDFIAASQEGNRAAAAASSSSSSSTSSSTGTNKHGDYMSSLDALLQDDDEDYSSRGNIAMQQQHEQPSTTTGAKERLSRWAIEKEEDDKWRDEYFNTYKEWFGAEEKKDPEWHSLVAKHLGDVNSDLELVQRRNAWLNSVDQGARYGDELNNEMDLKLYADDRIFVQMLERSKLGEAYDSKEQIRRAAEYEERGVVTGDLPTASLEILDNAE